MVAMSGGTDSSAAALLLQRQGLEVEGLTMLLHDGEAKGLKTGEEAVRSAAEVCLRLGIKHRCRDYRKEFRKLIMDSFIEGYLAGRTPNPCVLCNRDIKFGLFLKAASESGFPYMATGHYARVIDGRLYRGLDPEKDQSYFLNSVKRSSLIKTLFPLGEMYKEEALKEVLSSGIKEEKPSESQDICFIPGGDYREFLRHEGIKSIPGDIVDDTGLKVGEHSGIINYTVGQRKGLGAFGERMFVTGVQPSSNRIEIGKREDLLKKRLSTGPVNYTGKCPEKGEEYGLCIRYRAPVVKAEIIEFSSGGMKLAVPEGCGPVTPGQSAVLYEGGRVVAGAVILG